MDVFSVQYFIDTIEIYLSRTLLQLYAFCQHLSTFFRD